ncbi:hypothetical protein [Streptomyces sp. NPDC051576]|uniref:hypothetical protein n=1 Tax=Streptomyces sp. NPDC051576 TaxID=3155803 RepID=UPI00343EACAF
MGALYDYFHATDHTTAVDQAISPICSIGPIGPKGNWLQGSSLKETGGGAGWIDTKGLDPDIVLAQLVAYAEAPPFTDQLDKPEPIRPEPPYPQREPTDPNSPTAGGTSMPTCPRTPYRWWWPSGTRSKRSTSRCRCSL